MKLFDNLTTEDNILHMNGMNLVQLKEKYQTPLFVMDGDYIKSKCQKLKQNFKHSHLKTEILFASKAFCSKAIYQLMDEMDLSIDVVSGGELTTAIHAGFPMERVYFHGNNKSFSEIKLALDNKVNRIIVDNLMELEYIESLGQNVSVLIRVNPGIEAHTHEYIQTSLDDSKFGISFGSEDLRLALELIQNSETITLKGLHCHIGSQIHESSTFEKTAYVMLDQIKLLEFKYNLKLEELNLGGGFGVYYKGDQIIEDYGFLLDILNQIHAYSNNNGLNIKKVMIEPGRFLVANAGVTLYDVGFLKETLSGKQYLFVDGGMTDNIRPALYQAEYEACLANNVTSDETRTYTVAGKCCESGDILIQSVELPLAQTGDTLCVFSTGAYGYSMASNYNRIPRPGVVLIENGEDRIIIERESYDDLVRLDR